MTYTEKQIENAKKAYNQMLVLRTVESYEPEFIGWAAAEQRCEYHNNIVREIKSGNRDLEKEWKLFFLNQEVKADQKANESKVSEKTLPPFAQRLMWLAIGYGVAFGVLAGWVILKTQICN